jgi:hypothetical protein
VKDDELILDEVQTWLRLSRDMIRVHIKNKHILDTKIRGGGGTRYCG